MKTMAEEFSPVDGIHVEFWTKRMSTPGQPGTGITGVFRKRLFWSNDDADHWAPSEIAFWIYAKD